MLFITDDQFNDLGKFPIKKELYLIYEEILSQLVNCTKLDLSNVFGKEREVLEKTNTKINELVKKSSDLFNEKMHIINQEISRMEVYVLEFVDSYNEKIDFDFKLHPELNQWVARNYKFRTDLKIEEK